MHQKPLSILFADDDPEDREHLQYALLQADATLHLIQVRNGAEVIEYLSLCRDHELPDMLILDYNMPLVNGLEVLVKIGKDARYAAIPKVMYSTSDAPFHKEMCLHAGACQYFVKPNDRNGLLQIAREMIAVVRVD